MPFNVSRKAEYERNARGTIGRCSNEILHLLAANNSAFVLKQFLKQLTRPRIRVRIRKLRRVGCMRNCITTPLLRAYLRRISRRREYFRNIETSIHTRTYAVASLTRAAQTQSRQLIGSHARLTSRDISSCVALRFHRRYFPS